MWMVPPGSDRGRGVPAGAGADAAGVRAPDRTPVAVDGWPRPADGGQPAGRAGAVRLGAGGSADARPVRGVPGGGVTVSRQRPSIAGPPRHEGDTVDGRRVEESGGAWRPADERCEPTATE